MGGKEPFGPFAITTTGGVGGIWTRLDVDVDGTVVLIGDRPVGGRLQAADLDELRRLLTGKRIRREAAGSNTGNGPMRGRVHPDPGDGPAAGEPVLLRRAGPRSGIRAGARPDGDASAAAPCLAAGGAGAAGNDADPNRERGRCGCPVHGDTGRSGDAPPPKHAGRDRLARPGTGRRVAPSPPPTTPGRLQPGLPRGTQLSPLRGRAAAGVSGGL